MACGHWLGAVRGAAGPKQTREDDVGLLRFARKDNGENRKIPVRSAGELGHVPLSVKMLCQIYLPIAFQSLILGSSDLATVIQV